MQTFFDWIVGHQVVLAGVVVAVFDFIFALKKDWESNGILHFFYVGAKKLAGASDAPKA